MADAGLPRASALRELMLAGRFGDVLEIAADGADRARAAGDGRRWRRLSCDRGVALLHLGRLAESLAVTDEVAADGERAGAPEDSARAWTVGALAADRLGRTAEGLRRLDSALAAGEHLHREADRLDVLGKAATSAGTLGMPELGDDVLTGVLRDIGRGPVGALSTGSLLWLRGQHVLMRLWQGMAAEHGDTAHGDTAHGDTAHGGTPGAESAFRGAAEICRDVLDEPGIERLPLLPVAAFQGMLGFALTALGRSGEAAPVLAAAARLLPAEPFQMLSGGVEITTGTSALRADPPRDRATLHATGRRLVGFAQRCADVRFEAEIWRRWGALSAERGDDLHASLAAERFEALTDRLDWRRRVDGASLTAFRSATLSRIARGESWQPS